MKKIFIAMCLVLLAGCGAADRGEAYFTGYSELCVDGVTYLQFASGATIKVDLNGKPVACKK